MSYLNLMYNGMIIGMRDMGAEFVKVTDTHIFFDVKKGSEIDDTDRLIRANEAFESILNKKIKYKRI